MEEILKDTQLLALQLVPYGSARVWKEFYTALTPRCFCLFPNVSPVNNVVRQRVLKDHKEAIIKAYRAAIAKNRAADAVPAVLVEELTPGFCADALGLTQRAEYAAWASRKTEEESWGECEMRMMLASPIWGSPYQVVEMEDRPLLAEIVFDMDKMREFHSQLCMSLNMIKRGADTRLITLLSGRIPALKRKDRSSSESSLPDAIEAGGFSLW